MYASFYGLKQEPFNLTPDPQFFYLSEKHQKGLAHLLYGINNRKGFIALTGEVGAGKTTLCRLLLKQLDETVSVALILNSLVDQLTLLKQINRDFGIPFESSSHDELVGHLYDFLIEAKRNNRNVVVIVDECQNLKFDVLEQIRMLSNLETEKDKLLQILLIGQPEFMDMLNSHELRQLNQRITVRAHLSAFSIEEMKEYITHRLRIAGNENAIQLTRGALKKIFAYSEGVPRKTNVICDYVLLAGYAENTTKITPAIVEKAMEDLVIKRSSEFPSSKQSGRTSKRHSAGYSLRILAQAAILLIAIFVYRDNIRHGVASFSELWMQPLPSASGLLNAAVVDPDRRVPDGNPVPQGEPSSSQEEKSARQQIPGTLEASKQESQSLDAPVVPPASLKGESLPLPKSSSITIEVEPEPDNSSGSPSAGPSAGPASTAPSIAAGPQSVETLRAVETLPTPDSTPSSRISATPEAPVPGTTPVVREAPEPKKVAEEAPAAREISDAAVHSGRSTASAVDAYFNTLSSEEKALWLLLSTWGLDIRRDRRDESGERVAFKPLLDRFSFTAYSTWADLKLLKKMNLPCAVLIQQNGEKKYWVLNAILGERLRFCTAPEETTVISESEFMPLWQGSSVVLVEKGENTLLGEQVMYKGMQGPAIVQLKGILKHLSFFKGVHDELFDLELEQSVKKFQKSMGLTEDGIVGVEAKLLFYSKLSKNIPRLVVPSPSASNENSSEKKADGSDGSEKS